MALHYVSLRSAVKSGTVCQNGLFSKRAYSSVG